MRTQKDQKQNKGLTASTNVVQYLREKRGMTLREIGEAVGQSESFVCRVGRGQRRFTLEHLLALEGALGMPLPMILADAADLRDKPAELQPLYDAFRELCRRLSGR